MAGSGWRAGALRPCAQPPTAPSTRPCRRPTLPSTCHFSILAKGRIGKALTNPALRVLAAARSARRRFSDGPGLRAHLHFGNSAKSTARSISTTATGWNNLQSPSGRARDGTELLHWNGAAACLAAPAQAALDTRPPESWRAPQKISNTRTAHRGGRGAAMVVAHGGEDVQARGAVVMLVAQVAAAIDAHVRRIAVVVLTATTRRRSPSGSLSLASTLMSTP